MKTTALIVTILLITMVCRSQRPMLPIAPTPGPGPVPPILDRPIVVGGDVIVPAVPTGEPANIMETNPAEMETNGLAPNNGYVPPSLGAAETNTTIPELASAYALTNRLSVMAPAQVQGVLQVQSGLGSLQDVAESIHAQPSLLVAIQQNPQIQRRVDQVCDDIINLTRGPAKPSRDSVDRISMDLLRATSSTRLPPDQELILAVVINLACNSERLSASDLDNAVNDGVAVLRANGVAPAVCYSFGSDLRSIAIELQPTPGI